jgi:hypothetical protein
MQLTPPEQSYRELLELISNRYQAGKAEAAQAINAHMVATYWAIGQYIVEFEQQGHSQAPYGEGLLKHLATDLNREFGKGFSLPNLYNMRLFYQRFPIFQTLSEKLSWSHYVEPITIEGERERSDTN